MFAHSLNRPPIYPPTDILTHSLARSLARSLTHSLTHSLTLVTHSSHSLAHSLARSLTHSLIHSLARSSHSLTQSSVTLSISSPSSSWSRPCGRRWRVVIEVRGQGRASPGVRPARRPTFLSYTWLTRINRPKTARNCLKVSAGVLSTWFLLLICVCP